MFGRLWTQEEENILFKDFKVKTIKEFATELNRSARGVKDKLYRLGLKGENPIKIRTTIPTLCDNVCSLIAWSISWEGTIKLSSSGKERLLCPDISISNTNKDLLERFYQMVGFGHISSAGSTRFKTKNMKQLYVWRIKGIRSVKRLLEQILSFLPSKKQQAELLLEFCKIRLNNNDAHGKYGVREWEIKQGIRSLNLRGRGLHEIDVQRNNDLEVTKKIWKKVENRMTKTIGITSIGT